MWSRRAVLTTLACGVAEPWRRAAARPDAGVAAGAAAGTAARPGTGTAPEATAAAIAATGTSLYERALVVDALCDPGGYAPGQADDAPLRAEFVAHCAASGITLIHNTVNEVGNGPDRFVKTVSNIAWIEAQITAHPEVFLKVQRHADLLAAKSSGRMGIVYGCQDTSMLEGDLGRLKLFHGLGVRFCQPTYNRRNLMGDGCLEEADGGLSRLGHEFVAEANRLRMIVDLSHAGPRTIEQGIRASSQPVAITHTGCRALADLPRNTHDQALRALAERGGVAGIYFMPFLRTAGQPHAEDVIRHLEHAVQVCGEDHVGLGTDGSVSGITLDAAYREHFRQEVEARRKAGISAPGEDPEVFTLVPEYNAPRRFEQLAHDLTRRGWPEARIGKILGSNFARLFAEVCG